MSKNLFKNDFNIYFNALNTLVSEMLGSSDQAETVSNEFIKNVNEAYLKGLEQEEMEKYLFKLAVNNTIDFIDFNYPNYFNDCQNRLIEKVNEHLNNKLKDLDSHIDKSIVKFQHFYKLNYLQIANKIKVKENKVNYILRIQNIKIFDVLDLKIEDQDYAVTNSDHQIIKSIINDDNKNCKDVVIAKYENSIFKYLLNFVKNKHETVRITKNTFQTVFKNLQYIGNQSLTSFIFKIATNLAIEHSKSTHNFDYFIQDSKTTEEQDYANLLTKNLINSVLHSDYNTDKSKITAVENYYSNYIKELFQSLAGKYADILKLKYLFNLSPIEISHLVNKPIVFVRAQIIKGERYALDQINVSRT